MERSDQVGSVSAEVSKPSSLLDDRLRGTFVVAVVRELFMNSAHLPLALLLLEILREGAAVLAVRPDPYALLFGAIVQAVALTAGVRSGRPRPLLGNLVGPAVYSAVETAFEGWSFFLGPHHLAYWGFALLVGLSQSARGALRAPAVFIETMTRAVVLFVLYWIFEAHDHPETANPRVFFADAAHVYLGLSVAALGVLLGLARLSELKAQTLLRGMADRLRVLSEWSLGRNIVMQAVDDPASLDLARRERAVLFMDIRGFTAWSETRPPERVVSMLNQYYEAAERVWGGRGVIRAKLTADEVMLVLPTAHEAVEIGLALRRSVGELLDGYGLSAGIGIHVGPVVEGLLGGEIIKSYDVIGDTVNTAKRACDAAAGDEILVTGTAWQALGRAAPLGGRHITAKGKADPVAVHSLASADEGV